MMKEELVLKELLIQKFTLLDSKHMKEYNHKEIEEKWQKKWEDSNLYKTENNVSGKENHYVLVEFPYPSGNLHVGHWYAFGVTDIYARYMKLRGKNVMFPIGFDAFGLPAENAAIKNGLNPRIWTEENMEAMRSQLGSMGAMFDWSREVVTCHPDYYKWTQWLFLQLHSAGLVEKRSTTVNWDPVDKTVLANEQVLSDGTAERSGALVEQKEMNQWTVGITKYADKLIDDLDELDWPQAIKDSQKNWIGRSEGAELSFEVKDSHLEIDVFTTRPDTLFGVTYMVLAPEHKLVKRFLEEEMVSNKDEVLEYIETTTRKSERDRLIGEKEKTGVLLDGVMAINPANSEEIPVFIADYVLAGYGTGAVMAVPAHDERDNEFAKKFGLEIKPVIAEVFADKREPHIEGKESVYRKGVVVVLHNSKDDTYLILDWPKQNWKTFVCGGLEGDEDFIEAAKREVQEETGYVNISFSRLLIGPVLSEFFAKHKDVNRIAEQEFLLFELESDEQVAIGESEKEKHQHYWVPLNEITEAMNHSEMKDVLKAIKTKESYFYAGSNGKLINSEQFNGFISDDAKQKITTHVGGKMTNTYKLRDWIVSRQRYWGCPIPFIHCESCGAVPVPEEQLPVVLPDVKDYLPNDLGQSPLSKAEDWVNVTCPNCDANAKRETDTLDTFVDSSWYFLRYCDANNEKEFATKEQLENWMPVDFYSGGAEHTTMHVLYSRFFHKALFDLGLVPEKEPYTFRLNRGLILGTDGNKMSKSKGNVIDPDKEVAQFGADVVRTYLAFLGPYNEPGNYPWDQNGIVGIRRFMERFASLEDHIVESSSEEVTRLLHQTIKRVGEDIQRLKLNTAISHLMILLTLVAKEGIDKAGALQMIIMISSFAPHLSEELWESFGENDSVHGNEWPEYDESKLQSDEITLAIQINGKVRDEIIVSKDVTEEDLKKEVVTRENVQKWLGDEEIKKFIYIKNKLISIVI